MKYSASADPFSLNPTSKILSSILALSVLFFSGCKKNHDPSPTPSINSFSPASGNAGTLVTINGVNFSATPAENTVTFNGTAAEVNQADANQIIAIVPSGATTGKIAIAVRGVVTTSATDFTVLPSAPTITSFDPTSGAAGTVVTITGTSFSSTISDNAVTINGTPATITAANSTQLTVTIPSGATTGKIAITVNGQTGASANDFTVFQAPTISSFTPTFYDTSTPLPTVTITGTNFSPTSADNVVKFNGVTATLTSATTTQLTMTLPSGATSGKITVVTHGLTATSATDFLVGCPDVIVTDITISNISGDSFDVTYHIKNIGGVPLDINNMYFQAYISKAATLDGLQYVGAGGDPRYGYFKTYDLLAPNATLQLQRSAVNGGSITTYPYFVLQINRELNGPIECSTSNNTLGAKIQP